MRHLWILAAIATVWACGPGPTPPRTWENIPLIDRYDQLAARLAAGGDTTYVLNFWATTCPPCREEMPHFEQLRTAHPEEPMAILLLSMDRPADAGGRVLRYVQEQHLQNEVWLLADPARNEWTARVDTSWYGALPATLVVRGDRSAFQFGAFERFSQLDSFVMAVHP